MRCPAKKFIHISQRGALYSTRSHKQPNVWPTSALCNSAAMRATLPEGSAPLSRTRAPCNSLGANPVKRMPFRQAKQQHWLACQGPALSPQPLGLPEAAPEPEAGLWAAGALTEFALDSTSRSEGRRGNSSSASICERHGHVKQ